MNKLTWLLIAAAGLAQAADVHYAWLMTATNVPGVPDTQTPTTQYGVQVFMDSDNPNVTEFQVTIVVQLATGDIVTSTGTVPRVGKAGNVTYSTAYAAWVGPNPNFQLLSLQVKAATSKTVTKPFPGRDYSSDVPTAAPTSTTDSGGGQ
jgi:hypothetical protein